MMINSTKISYFTLAAYFDTGPFKYLYFVIVMSQYIFIIFANVLLIVIICMNRSLHEPMYLFLCSLFVNELYGSTALFLFLIVQILSDIHTVSASVCYLQIFCVHSYGAIEYLNLAIMSYDRYLALCYPLQYNTRMTFNKIAMLVAVTWLYPLIACAIMIGFSSSLRLCDNIIYKVYCDNYSIIKLSCSETNVIQIFGLIGNLGTVVTPVILIFYTYFKIFRVCFSGSKQIRQKAYSTCTPHLASVLNFAVGAIFETSYNRFNMKNAPTMLHIIMSLYFLTCPPLFNPVIYGLNLSKIRVIFKHLISKVCHSY